MSGLGAGDVFASGLGLLFKVFGGRPWWLSVTGPGPSFGLALHCSTALGRDDRLPRRDPGFLMQQRLGYVGSYVTHLLRFYFCGIFTRTQKLASHLTAYRVSIAQLWHNWAVCCATWARGTAALQRTSCVSVNGLSNF